MFGISFDRFYFADKSIRKMEVKGNKLIWRKEKEDIKDSTAKSLLKHAGKCKGLRKALKKGGVL